MGVSAFKDRAVLAGPGNPCPICGRPSGSDPRSKGKCLISREGEHEDAAGNVWRNPAGAQVHCIRIAADRVGGYVLQRGDKSRVGGFYLLEDSGEIVRRADGSEPGTKRRPRRTAPPAPPTPEWINRLQAPLAPIAMSDKEAQMSRLAVELWGDRMLQDRTGLALAYLASRGIDAAWLASHWPESLGWSPFVWNKELRKAGRPHEIPALLARVDAPDGTHVATHRIYLRADGSGKADVGKAKMLLGPQCEGAIRLATPAARGGTLVLCEGIETGVAVLSAVRGASPEGRPAHAGGSLVDHAAWGVWACVSTSGLRSLVIDPELVRSGRVSRVLIAADIDRSIRRPSPADASGKLYEFGLKGQEAARAAQARLVQEYPGLAVGIAWPGMGTLTRWDEQIGECVPGRALA